MECVCTRFVGLLQLQLESRNRKSSNEWLTEKNNDKTFKSRLPSERHSSTESISCFTRIIELHSISSVLNKHHSVGISNIGHNGHLLHTVIRTLFLTTLIGLVFSKKELKVKVANCTQNTGYEARITDITLSPESPEPADKNFSMIATAIASETISEGKFQLVVKLFGIPVLTEKANLCAPEKFSLPASAGNLYWEGVECPVKKGSKMEIKFVSDISSATPDATVKIALTVDDTKTNQHVACLNMAVQVTG